MATTTYDGRPAQHDLYIVRGDTWTQDFVYESPADTPVDLSGYSARLQIRANRLASSPALLSVSSAGGEITLGGAAGTIDVEVDALVTAALDFDQARWDLELTSSGGIVTTLIEGNITLIKDVTR